MVVNWLEQLGAAAVKLLIHPVFYFSLILAFVVGMLRVARERKDFGVRIYDMYQEIRLLWPASLAACAVLSAITIGAGLALPADLLRLMAALLILCSAAGFFLLSPAWTLGLAYLVFFLTEQMGFSLIAIGTLDFQLILTVLALLTGLLLITEGVLIHKRGYQGTTPRIEKGKRGLQTAVHTARRLWLIPVFLPVPASRPLEPFASWWPLIDIGAEHYYLTLFPFLIGFSMTIRSRLPKNAVQSAGRSVQRAGVLAVLLAIASCWYWPLSAAAVLAAALARAGLAFWFYRHEKHQPAFFTPQSNGVMVAAVLPASPARKMGLEIGEVIRKVNGVPVGSEPEFYKALQKNGAYCKMDVIGTNGQLRFVQGSIYENQHHELGLILAPEEKQYSDDSVFTD